jgi:hypothetical protein
MRRGAILAKYAILVAVALLATGGCARLGEWRGPTVSRLAVIAAGGDAAAKDPLASRARDFEPDLTIALEIDSATGGPFWIAFGPADSSSRLFALMIDNTSPILRGSEEWGRLLESLSLAEPPWKVVFLRAPVLQFGPEGMDRSQLHLAELLAQEKVALAFAPGDGSYERTARIGPTSAESVQYVTLPTGRPAEDRMAPPWISRRVSGACLGLLSADEWRLRWEVRDAGGELLDLVQVPAAAAKKYQPKFFTFGDLMTNGGEIDAGAEGEQEGR